MDRKTLLEAFATGIAGALCSYIVPMACDALVPALQGNALAANPIETTVLGGCAAFLGFAAGWLARGRAFMAPAGRQSRAERDKAAKREHEAGMRGIKQLPPSIKALMLAAATKGAAYCDMDDWAYTPYADDPFYTQFLETEYIDGDRAKITATHLLRDVYGKEPSLFSAVTGTLSQHGVARGSRPHGCSSDGTPFWWWYR